MRFGCRATMLLPLRSRFVNNASFFSMFDREYLKIKKMRNFPPKKKSFQPRFSWSEGIDVYS